MPDRPHRLTVVLSHPIQYMSPWFRYIAAERREIDLTVLYATAPAAAAQGVGFGVPFQWDVALLDGYRSRVLSDTPTQTAIAGDRFVSLDAPRLESALVESQPDAVLVPGWHVSVYRQAVAGCRARRIPLIYRGDTSLLSAPSGWRRPLWRAHTRRRLREYDAWLAVGRAARAYLGAFHVPEPLVFASPHAVDNDALRVAVDRFATPGARAELRKRLTLEPDGFTVLFAGKLQPGKRALDAVRAVAQLGAGAQLLIAGAGAEEPACREEAHRLGVRTAFRGFVNQSEMPQLYAAADCLVLPSASETWGLVVNEALASGRPAVVSDRVGCAADLIVPGDTGEIAPVGDIETYAAALARVRARTASSFTESMQACRQRVAGYSYAAASDGLVEALDRLRRRQPAGRAAAGAPRVIACCGGMVVAGGLERMTFEVLRTLRERGAVVHAIVNPWESRPIVGLAESAGASWTIGYYWYSLSRNLIRPHVALTVLWQTMRVSVGLLQEARRVQASHILLPDFAQALWTAPALCWLRRRGVAVIMRLGDAPTIDRRHRRLWRSLIDPLVDRYVPNSAFIAAELARHDLDPAKITVVYNTPARRSAPAATPAFAAGRRDASRVIYVGQLIPPKGIDVLLDAVALVASRGIPITLELVGRADGWESPAYAGYFATLRARAAQPDLAGRVVFAGYQESVADRYASAAVHCLPSQPEIREGMAGVVLEAKMAGVPSVVTPTGSLPELVHHRIDGWITRDASAGAIAEGLEYFLSDARARADAGAAALASIETFSRTRFERAWLGIFAVDEATAGRLGAGERRAS